MFSPVQILRFHGRSILVRTLRVRLCGYDRGALIAHFEASKSMKHVKPALDYAIDTITIEEDFLENYKFELEYGNSQCSKDAKLIASDMYYGSLQKGNFSKNRQIFQR